MRLSAHAAARLGWSLAALSATLLLTGFVLSLASGGLEANASPGLAAALVVGFAVVGALIASRHPGNMIGWLFCGIGVGGSLMSLARGCAELWLDGSGVPTIVGETAAWYGDVSWIPVILPAATFLLLLFPDGRLPSRRWRPVAWSAGLGIALAFIADSLGPGRLSDFPNVENPYAVDSPVLEALGGLAALLLLVAIVGSPLSLVLRFRRAGREQRQQIKWLALAGAVAAATFLVAIVTYELLPDGVADSAIMLSIVALPVAAGIAILRYRLYDIDVVINRTLVYGALTATLAGAYLGLVLLLQLALSPITEESDLAIAGSTLAVAALFRPARARIQAAVDRRFYRGKYDAQRTLESFSAQLRDEVDLAALGIELNAVVRETLQPSHVSLWLRTPGETR
jgi:hypothetical protein